YHPIPHRINSKNYVNCNHCNALKLPSESPGMCYSNGKVMLVAPDVPPFLNHLLTSQNDIAKNFRYKIRAYNSVFTFTSTSAKLDNNLANAQSGVYTYCVQGSFYYRIGSLLPENAVEPRYLQMYVWDTQHELDHQTNVIPNSGLNPALIQSLKTILDKVNPYVINLRYISRLPTENIANLAILIHTDNPGLDLRTFNVPIASQVAAIWVDTEIPTDVIQNRDIVLHTKMDKLIHISKISACYDPLAYPILFLYSKQGWSPCKISYKTLPFKVIDSTIDENSHNKEDEEDEGNIQEYEIRDTNINEAPNDEEDATDLENSNEPPNDDEDSTIENNKAINSNVSTKWHRKFISVPEAAWRILGFKINRIHPVVTRLQLHLQDQQRVNFAESSNLSEIATAERNQCTTLTEYFQKNAKDPKARNLLYANFSMHYTWNKQIRKWTKRKREGCIGRIYIAYPNEVKGARSFNDLKKVNGIICETFKESALLRGFLENDDSHRQCMAEAWQFRMSSQLHAIFATLLIFADIADVPMLEDFVYTGIPNSQYLIQATFQHLNALLRRHSKTISDYDLLKLLDESINSEFSALLLE
ncbi:4452_t:CDS:2, partial [Gigaspora margarita]